MSADRKIIMGIDPGTNYTGYGLLCVEGNAITCVGMGVVDLHKIRDTYGKLRSIFEEISALIRLHGPCEVALESPFFGENVQSMLKLGRAQGVAMAAALTQGLPVAEYAPRRIKQSITGNGAASKQQVAAMLRSYLRIDTGLRDDATDGLAVALCHYFESRSAVHGAQRQGSAATGKRAGTWEKFLSDNPGRKIKG